MIVYGRVVLGPDCNESVLDFCSTLLSMVGHSCKTLRRTALLITLSFSHLRTGDYPYGPRGREFESLRARHFQELASINSNSFLFLLDFARLFCGKISRFLCYRLAHFNVVILF